MRKVALWAGKGSWYEADSKQSLGRMDDVMAWPAWDKCVDEYDEQHSQGRRYNAVANKFKRIAGVEVWRVKEGRPSGTSILA